MLQKSWNLKLPIYWYTIMINVLIVCNISPVQKCCWHKLSKYITRISFDKNSKIWWEIKQRPNIDSFDSLTHVIFSDALIKTSNLILLDDVWIKYALNPAQLVSDKSSDNRNCFKVISKCWSTIFIDRQHFFLREFV